MFPAPKKSFDICHFFQLEFQEIFQSKNQFPEKKKKTVLVNLKNN